MHTAGAPCNESPGLGTEEGDAFSNVLGRNVGPLLPGSTVATLFDGFLKTADWRYRPRGEDLTVTPLRPSLILGEQQRLRSGCFSGIIGVSRRQFRWVQRNSDQSPPTPLVHARQHKRHQGEKRRHLMVQILQRGSWVKPVERLRMPAATKADQYQISTPVTIATLPSHVIFGSPFITNLL